MFKRAGLLISMLLVATLALAQSTRVRGIVRDADTGEPLPFVGVYFDGTTIGISTDMEGRYSLETRSREARVLTAQLIGYENLSVEVTQGAFTEINFALRPDPKQLQAALVKPDDHYIKSILRKLDRCRAVNDPDNASDWSTHLYTKIEMDVTNMEDFLKLGVLEKNLGFIRQYSDTSAITGKAYIPAMISENVSDLYHSQDPSFDREVMRASRISGLDEDNIVRQFTGSYLLRTNFYKRSIDVFNLSIPNPAAASSAIFYNYFLVDSLQVEGRKTYVLRFHPKKLVTSPTFDGEMHIDAQDFGIRSVHVQLSKSSNVNWIRHINMDIENRRLPDGRWFYGEERLFIDFSLTVNDNSKLISFLGHRHMTYDPPVFGPITDKDALTADNAVVMRNVVKGDNSFWSDTRPYPLTPREQGIYDMVDHIQTLPFYKWTYNIANTWITGYLDVPAWGVEFGRWARTFVHNDVEGFRMQLGGRTTHFFSQKVRFSGYIAYGFKDHTPKGWAQVEYIFNREKTRKLTAAYKKDFSQLGGGTGVFSAQNMFSSIIARDHNNRMTMVRSASILYEHEFNPIVDGEIGWESRRMWSNEAVPIYTPDGTRTLMESLAVHELHASIRLSKDERVNRTYFSKHYLYTKYPTLTLGVTGGFKGISQNDVNFIRTQAVVGWKVPSTAIGFGKLRVEAGAIFGNVPHPLLKLHEGNQTYFMDRTAFSCMDYYEFASDRWLSGYYEHNFNGFFLGKIPLIKKLDLREVVTARFAWGDISEKNRLNALQETQDLNTPYVELGVGISNLFRLLRVDFFWRTTHLRPEKNKNWSVNLGIDVEF